MAKSSKTTINSGRTSLTRRHMVQSMLALAVSFGSVASVIAETDRLADIKADVARDFPTVKHISVNQFLSSYGGWQLVDVRSEPEYAVSRIPGALNFPDHESLLAYANEHPHSRLVLYCSVGVRSAVAADFLGTQVFELDGAPEVVNLAGSIFEWSNLGLPLENDQGPTDKVHPFNAWWGWRYLD